MTKFLTLFCSNTIQSLDMEEGDTIEVFTQQSGGGGDDEEESEEEVHYRYNTGDKVLRCSGSEKHWKRLQKRHVNESTYSNLNPPISLPLTCSVFSLSLPPTSMSATVPEESSFFGVMAQLPLHPFLMQGQKECLQDNISDRKSICFSHISWLT